VTKNTVTIKPIKGTSFTYKVTEDLAAAGLLVARVKIIHSTLADCRVGRKEPCRP
jgi:hypothetical protein